MCGLESPVKVDLELPCKDTICVDNPHRIAGKCACDLAVDLWIRTCQFSAS